MLFRKIGKHIENHLKSDSKKIMVINGARQIGKTYIIREIGRKLFENFIEINLLNSSLNNGYFSKVKSVFDFYLQISMTAGHKMNKWIHSALKRFVNSSQYNVKKAYVLSNERIISKENNIIYMPIYFVIFL